MRYKFTSNTLQVGGNHFHKPKKSCISEYFKNGEDLIDLFGNEDPVGM